MRIPILESGGRERRAGTTSRRWRGNTARRSFAPPGECSAPPAAEDVQQQVFLRLIESPPQNVESWPAYLTTVGTRLAIDHLRRQRRWSC